jgi:hypothetical protein
MAESLLVRKGGGGGYPVVGIEKNLTIQTGSEPIKKGDFLESNILDLTVKPEIYTNNQIYANTNASNYDKNFVKIDEKRVIHITVTDGASQGTLILWLVKRDDDNNLTFSNLFTSSTNDTYNNGNFYSGIYLSDNVFIVASRTAGVTRIQAFRINQNDTVTAGTIHTYNNVVQFAALNNDIALGKVTKNNFIIGFDLFNNSQDEIHIRYGTVNLTNLNITTDNQLRIGTNTGGSSVFRGNFINFDNDERLQNSTSASGTVQTKTLLCAVDKVSSTQAAFVVMVNVSFNSSNVFTGLQGFQISSNDVSPNYDTNNRNNNDGLYEFGEMSTFNVYSIQNSPFTRIYARYGVTPILQTQTNVNFFTGKLYQIGKKTMAFIGTAGATTNVRSMLINFNKNYDNNIIKEEEFSYKELFTSNGLYSFSAVKFNDGTIIFARNYYLDSSTNDRRIRYRVIEPVITVNKISPTTNYLEKKYGIALQDGVAGQSIKVLVL